MTAVLTIKMISYWRAGTGRSRAGTLDATCQRDRDGLPVIPGKHLRGLLREAVRHAHDLEWITLSDTVLFGARPPFDDQNKEAYGTLRVETARLPHTDRAVLAKQGDLIPFLFATKRSTRIEAGTRTADPGSLRFEEVAVPVTLTAEVLPLKDAPEGWESEIRNALPLLRAIGAGRTRGLGRCIVTMTPGGGT